MKQKMVDDLLKTNESKSSFYVNEIIHSLPTTVLLKELDYQPLQKRIKADKKIELDENTIVISGSSNSSEIFSNWISQLGKMEWVFKVDIINYGLDSKTVSDFTIKIKLKND